MSIKRKLRHERDTARDALHEIALLLQAASQPNPDPDDPPEQSVLEALSIAEDVLKRTGEAVRG